MAVLSGTIGQYSYGKEHLMKGPAKNRLHDYEAGWLGMLVDRGLATREEAHDAMCRIAQSAIDQIHKKRAQQRKRRRRRKE
jgi:hypothetical protein